MKQKLISKNENPSIANWIFCEVYNLEDVSKIISIENEDSIHKDKCLSYLDRYLFGEPLARIFKKIHFYYHDFIVYDGVFCPRLDTEILVDKVLQICKNKNDLSILDLCSGTGIIGLSLKLALPYSKVTCVDINRIAIANIKDNAKKLNVNVDAIESNLFNNLQLQKFNVIVCNPPYISWNEQLPLEIAKFDPNEALFCNDNGLEIYKQIISQIKQYLTLESYLIAFEIGYKQGEFIKQMLCELDNSCIIEIYKDYNYLDRVIIARKGL